MTAAVLTCVQIRTVCAWCKDKETVLIDVPLDERGLSHGICKPCEKKWFEKREAALEMGAHRVASPMGYCTTGCPETVIDGDIAASPGWRQPQTRPDVSLGRRAPAPPPRTTATGTTRAKKSKSALLHPRFPRREPGARHRRDVPTNVTVHLLA